MTPEQQELLLTTARILRAHLKDTADHSPVGYDQIIQDVRDLNLALRPFESNVTAPPVKARRLGRGGRI